MALRHMADKLLPFIFAPIVFAFSGAAQGASLELSSNGETEYAIIQAKDTIPAEEFAANELRQHLYEVTGVRFSIIPETDSELPARGIYLGWTEFAASNGIQSSAFADEEWLVKTVNGNLILTGGRPRGVLYAVYEFLEQDVGCKWFDVYNNVIPSIPNLRIEVENRQGKPAFWDRHIYTSLHSTAQDQTLRARNKDTKPKPARYGFGHSLGTHTFWGYSKNFPSDKPEYLAMNTAGERPESTSGHGPGQICLTHPGARKHMLDQLKSTIAENFKAAEEADDGRQPQLVYHINQNDTHWICQCDECQEIAEREEADSGPYLDLINYLADGIRDEYPDVLIEGWAYSNLMKPPKTIRPRDNVVIRVVQLNAEWSSDALRGGENWLPEWYPDLFRPRNHPINKEATDILARWSDIARQLAIWTYWLQYSGNDRFPTPYVNLRNIHHDLQLFHRSGTGSTFVEYEGAATTSFFVMKVWVGWKLLQDPYQDLNNLVNVFMDGYYGPAAGKMTEYWNFLEDSIAAIPEEAGNISGTKASQRPYLTLEFYEKSQRLLDAAEALCDPGSRYLLNVQRERIPVDAGLYAMWGVVSRQLAPDNDMPWRKDAILERYEEYRIAQFEHRRHQSPGSPDSLKEHLEDLRQISESISKAKGQPPKLRVPQIPSAEGHPSRVDWSRAASVMPWRTLFGQDAPDRTVRGAMAHDERYLYIMLEESGVDTSKLSRKWWSGDAWELFFKSQHKDSSYQQIAINSNGEHLAYNYQNGQQQVDLGLTVVSDMSRDRWRVYLAVPLTHIAVDGISISEPLFANIFRHTKYKRREHLSWSPIFEAGYHDMTRLAKIVFE